MTIKDAFLEVSSAQDVTATAVSANSIDLSEARDVGEGEDLSMEFSCGANTAGTSGTIEFAIVVADDAALTSNVTTLVATAAIPQATLVDGYKTYLRIPPQIGSLGQRYLGAKYTVGGTVSSSSINAAVVKDIDDSVGKDYASGFTVE